MAHLVSNAWYGSFKLISFRNPQNCDECQTLQKIFILFLGTGLGTETQAWEVSESISNWNYEIPSLKRTADYSILHYSNMQREIWIMV